MPFGLLVGWGRTARRPYRDRAESVQTTSPRSAPCQSLSISASEAENAGFDVDSVVDAANTLAVFVWGPERVRLEYVEHKPSFSLT